MGRSHDSDFDKCFVLAVISDLHLRNYCINVIQPNFIIHWQYQAIYEAVTKLHHRKKPINFTSVIEEIKKDMSISEDKLDEVLDILRPYTDLDQNKEDILYSMTDRVLSGVEQEVGHNVMLQALSNANMLMDEGKHEEIFKLFDKAQQLAIYNRSSAISFTDSLDKDDNEEVFERGIPLGIHGEDRNMRSVSVDQELFYKGIPRGSLFIFAGEAKAGKSSLLQNIALYQMLSGFNVDFYTLENPYDYLQRRGVSILLDKDVNTFLDKTNWMKAKKKVSDICKSAKSLGTLRYFEEQAHKLTPTEIGMNIMESETMGRKIHVVIVDYLDLMGCEVRFRESYQSNEHNSIALRAMGQEYKCGVITGSQLKIEAKKQFGDRTDVRGGFARLFHADFFATITAEKEVQENYLGTGKDLTNVTMFLDAVRAGKGGLKILMKVNYASGRFYDPIPK